MQNPSLPKYKRDLSEQALGWLLLSPVIILLLVIVVYPIATLVYNSFFTIKIMEPYLGQPFVGLENFERAFEDERFWGSLWNTILYIVVTVPGSLVVGLGLALLANLPFKRQWPVRLALLLPWALPLVFAGLIFRWFFDFRLGFVNDLLVHFGFTAVPWLTSPIMAKIAICITIIWKSSSFMALILLAGLQSIPKSLYEAAEVDGASKWTQFKEITVPMLAPSIFVALIFRTITAIQTFDIPYAMTGGGPGESTETLAMYIHKTTLDFLDFGYGSALAVVLFLVSMVATSGYLKYTRRSSSRGDE
ncbi:MAG: sugar ABC transporter permease [Betaproteobacteria bacterium]|nr:sugar ABC transporter permease [Betaproteobacteria bacterium]